MELVTLAPLAVGSLSWRTPAGVEQLTVIVKATFELRHRKVARLIEPYALFEDLHYEENDGRSLRVASDYVPRKPSVDVIVTGAVYAPPGERVAERMVRFAVLAGDKPILDKKIRAVGGRERDAAGVVGAPVPFAYLPLRYELAYGGATSKSNPIGVGADPGDARQPSLLNPDNAQLVAGLGPVPPGWWWRKRALAGGAPPVLSEGAPTIPASLDFAYFNAAPPDQRIQRLVGDETVVIAGLHPSLAEASLPLPGKRAHAALDLNGRRREVPLLLDTLWLESDTLRCTLTWRGVTPLDAAEVGALATARLLATLAAGTQAPAWERKVAVDLRTTRNAESTRAPAEPPPVVAMRPVEPPAMVANRPVEPPAVIAGKPVEPPPLSMAASSSLRRTISVELEVDRALPVAPKSDAKPRPPARVTPHVPVMNDTRLVVWTTAWQVKPPEHSLTVIVKGTFRIGDDGSLTLADEQDPPSGDVPYDDEGETASLRYASDFAIFKPAADVTLVGHAYPTDPKSGLAVVDLRVGMLQRRVAVFGDRKWGEGERPAPFDKMPLRWERAMGGALSEANPVGRGYRTGVLLPNLERTGALVQAKGDTPAPACFAPVPPMWKARRSKLGSYDKTWLETRWPYFPLDFDWTYFNAAPAEQQLPYLHGDERFSISGVAPGGATIAGKLPDLQPRVFAQRGAEAGGDFFEVLLRLDTLSFDTDARKAVLVWRGLFAVADEDAPELATLFVDVDQGAPMTLERAEERFVARSAAVPIAASALAFADDAPPDLGGPPPGAPPPPTADQLRAIVAAKGALAAMDLTGAQLAGIDLSGVDLTGAILARADLTGANLDRAKLARAVLTHAKGEGASFDGADLTEADLTRANLAHATFRGATAPRAAFDRAKLTAATFVDAKCEGATFVGATLERATFDKAQLVGADLSGASLDGASFRGAALDELRLYDVRGSRVVFEKAKMGGVRAEKASLPGANLVGVAAAKSAWESADLTGAALSEGNFDGAIFTRAKLDGATMNKTTAVEASFRRASLKGAHCLKANFMQAVFERADLTGADVRGANLFQAETWRAKTDRLDLAMANVSGTKL
jgi:uncharacterized protein YjbI with pentapeptide repeats